MTVNELRKVLGKRKLDMDESKDVLVSRLGGQRDEELYLGGKHKKGLIHAASLQYYARSMVLNIMIYLCSSREHP